MFYLGLLLPCVFVAGYTGASIPTQWPFLTIALLPALWLRAIPTCFHWLGVAFLLYSLASIFWSASPYDSVYGLWLTIIWALSFWLGSSVDSLIKIWKGLALGLSISSIVALFQAFGFNLIPTFSNGDAGLLFNTTALAISISIVILGLVSEGLWFYIPSLIPGLYLSHSRGGWLVLIVGFLVRLHWSLGFILTSIVGICYLSSLSSSDDQRLRIWSVAGRGLSFFGWGIGTFVDIYYQYPQGHFTHPEFVHNDYLQLTFELGVGSIPIYCIFAGALSRTQSPTWPVAVAITVTALFYFPLYCPVPAFIAFVTSGYLLRGYDPIRGLRDRWGQYILLWRLSPKPRSATSRGQDIPMVLRTSA